MTFCLRPVASALLALALTALPAVVGSEVGARTADEGGAQMVVRTRADEVSRPVDGTAVMALPFATSHLAVHWTGNPDASLRIATSTDGIAFGPASDVGRDELGEQRGNGETYGAVLPGGNATSVRITSDRPVGRVTVLALADGERVTTGARVSGQVAATAAAQPAISPRGDWGADESLRFGAGTETWAPTFWPLQKLIVHHTASQNNDPNPRATIRSIYYYHAITQGWGDIGYNFLIDEAGTIYKGRHSHTTATPSPASPSPDDTITGENSAGYGVTGAHAVGFNSGTVGVALLGTLTGQDATPAARIALEEVLAWKAGSHAIDPNGSSLFTNPVSGSQRVIPNIAGHRDVEATECPGGTFYATLPAVRNQVALRISGSSPTNARYNPLTPARILDTRVGTGAPLAKLGPASTLEAQVTGQGGVPASGVSAVVLNITALAPTATSFLTAWPAGLTRPVASNLNYVPGDIVPNLVVVKVGAGGRVALYNHAGSVDVAADVAGYYGDDVAPAGARYNPLTPARILDTRVGTGAPLAKLGPASTLEAQVTGQGGVPASGVSAVVLNITALAPTATSFLTAWPAGLTRPVASNLNYVPGDIVPNLVVVKVGAGGRVALYNHAGSVDVAADVAGYYGDDVAPAGARYNPLTPARILDTRVGTGAPLAKLGPASTLEAQVTGQGGVPASGVSAVVLNITALAPTATSFLTAWPAGLTRPVASNLNYVPGDIVPNLVVVKVGAGGRVALYNHAGSVDVAADVAGWFTSE